MKFRLVFGLSALLASAEAFAVPPPSATQRYQEGLELSRKGQVSDALRKLREATGIDPTFAEAWVEAGNAALALDDVSFAIEAYRNALKARPGMSEAQYNLAHALRKANQLPDAAETYRAYLLRNPTDADAYFGLAETLRAIGDKHGSTEAFARYVKLEKRPDRRAFVEQAEAAMKELEAAPEGTPHLSFSRAKADPAPAAAPNVAVPEVTPPAAPMPDLKPALDKLAAGDFAGAKDAVPASDAPWALAARASSTLGLAEGDHGAADFQSAERAFESPAARAAARFGRAEALRAQGERRAALQLFKAIVADEATPAELRKLAEERVAYLD